MKAVRRCRLLYGDIIWKYSNAKEKYERLISRKESEQCTGFDDDSLIERINKAKEKYNNLLSTLTNYISFIPDERTRDCTYKAYIDGLDTQDLCSYYYVDESAITRELKCGRQIITALDSYKNAHNHAGG